nr:ABC transporter ATP-binding protein [Pseudomonadota bacterium]
LDSVSETAIRQALADLSKGRTTLVIAHRLSTILDADQIVVMQEGRIVDQGKHAELIKRDGIYNTLYELQFNQKSIVAASKDDEKQSPKKPTKTTGGFLSAWRDFLNEKN